jgi:hypothetical protein
MKKTDPRDKRRRRRRRRKKRKKKPLQECLYINHCGIS